MIDQMKVRRPDLKEAPGPPHPVAVAVHPGHGPRRRHRLQGEYGMWLEMSW